MKKGITLIELAIVFVVLGLLVGGALAAQSLIESSKIGQIIGDFQKFQTAVKSFQLEYDAYPGDMEDASSYWGSAADGDGDGDIEFQTSGTDREQLLVWQHLSLSGIIQGEYTGALSSSALDYNPGENIPENPIYAQSGYIIFKELNSSLYNSGTHLKVRLAVSTSSSSFGNSSLKAPQARQIDFKFDDGLADTGNFIAFKGAEQTATDTTKCVDNASYFTAPATYVLGDEEVTCRVEYFIE